MTIVSPLLSSFKLKIEEAVALLPIMVHSDEIKAVGFLNEMAASLAVKYPTVMYTYICEDESNKRVLPVSRLDVQHMPPLPNNCDSDSPDVPLKRKRVKRRVPAERQSQWWCNEYGLPKEYGSVPVTEEDFNLDGDDEDRDDELLAKRGGGGFDGGSNNKKSDVKASVETVWPIVTVEEGQTKYTCATCNSTFDKVCKYREHAAVHTKPFICDVCGTCFARKEYLKGHARIHTGEKPFKCPSCDTCFRTRAALNAHGETHGVVRPHVCVECGGRFKSKTGLHLHAKKHANANSLPCPECRKSVASQFGATEVDPDGRTNFFKCPLCLKRCDQQMCLSLHMSRHTENDDVCPVCGIRISSDVTLAAHIAQCYKASGHEEHRCEQCGKAFKNMIYLRRHLLRHGDRKFSCDTCPAKFFSNFNLREHMRIHTGERPFACELCGKTFRVKIFLKYHMNKHYGLRPYKCKFCDKSFADVSYVAKHIRMHENRRHLV